jgi:hypothetical protein
MQRLRTLHHKTKYTSVANAAIENLPDLNSIGLLATILRHSDNWDFDMKTLVKSKKGLGEQAAYKARSTLIAHGYIVQVKFRHTYRGRFYTVLYRAAEPHDADDLAVLFDRYRPGRQVTIVIGVDDADEPIEQVERIQWAEVTSFRGVELVDPETGEPVPRETSK